MALYYQEFGVGEPIVILHGLFGSSDNWISIAKVFSETYRVILPDIPHHGRSSHEPELTYPNIAKVIFEWLQELNLEKIDIIGHSMGGKIAMQLAQSYQDFISTLVIVDIAPKVYNNRHEEILKALSDLDLSRYQNRSEVDAALRDKLPDTPIRQFLLKSLDVSQPDLTWRFNLNMITTRYAEIANVPTFISPWDGPALFIKGAESDYIQSTDAELINKWFPQADIVSIPHTDHWVHAQNPNAFLSAIQTFYAAQQE